MSVQCKKCKHIWSYYRGGLSSNCPNCGLICTYGNTQQPDYGENTRRKYAQKQSTAIDQEQETDLEEVA